MGNEISQTLEGGEYGWRILKVMPNSPCGSPSFGLVPYFDVVTHVNGVTLSQSRTIIVEMIKDSEPTKLTIYNISTKHSREITVIPDKDWGGSGLLGLIIRFDCYEDAEDDVMHVLEVHPGSPAAKAGLVNDM